MVCRCGYFLKNNGIHCKLVLIDWDLGFDKASKHQYIDRLQRALGEEVGKSIEVTSASYVPEGKALSPIFVKMLDRDGSVEDYLQEKKNDGFPNIFNFYSIVEYIYLVNLSFRNRATIMEYDCFQDVFKNPEHGLYNTQAFCCVMYKYLYNTNQLHLLDNLDAYVEWRKRGLWTRVSNDLYRYRL